MKPRITLTEFERAAEDNVGWCSTCGEFTTDGVEPDAEGYECDLCGENTVMGATYAAISGEFSIAPLTSGLPPGISVTKRG